MVEQILTEAEAIIEAERQRLEVVPLVIRIVLVPMPDPGESGWGQKPESRSSKCSHDTTD